VRRAVRGHLRDNLAAYNVAILIDPTEAQLARPEQTATIELRNRYPDDRMGPVMSIENSSPEKDTGNRVRNEHVGGFNPQVEAAGLSAHGGVFVGGHFEHEMFNKLKPHDDEDLSRVPSETRFDAIFRDFSPRMNGTPLQVFPGSRDDARATEAINAAAAIIAATTTRVIGYLVGLPINQATGNAKWNNEGDNGCYLDHGSVRSFEERAKLDGQRERFCPANDAYLRQILPRLAAAPNASY